MSRSLKKSRSKNNVNVPRANMNIPNIDPHNIDMYGNVHSEYNEHPNQQSSRYGGKRRMRSSCKMHTVRKHRK